MTHTERMKNDGFIPTTEAAKLSGFSTMTIRRWMAPGGPLAGNGHRRCGLRLFVNVDALKRVSALGGANHAS